jgi:hypothetical protein
MRQVELATGTVKQHGSLRRTVKCAPD